MRSALLLLTIAAAGLHAQTVETLIDHGNATNRIDLVIVGDGYTAAEAGKFRNDAQRLAASFFADDVYKEYAPYFNVRAVTISSNQSGASHPEMNPPVVRDTAFNAAYFCAGVVRLICVNNAKVSAVVNAALPASQRDFVAVLVNDPVYGGAGGSLIVSSTHSQSVEIALHESGHSIGLLADEYVDQPPVCNLSAEPVAANSTRMSSRSAVKWSAWIDAATAVPSLVPAIGQPGLFEGSDYCPSGKYRPTFNSKMRALGNPFEAVNAEQLIRRFYNFVSPIDSVSPSESAVTATRGTPAEFRVAALSPASHPLTVTWTVDGSTAAGGPTFLLDTAQLAIGSHTVRVEVRDVTARVRSDPSHVLADSHSWPVFVTAAAPVHPRRPVIGSVEGAGLSVPAISVLSAGGLFSIFGSDFTEGTARSAGTSDTSGGNLPANLGQTCVQVGTVRAPLSYVSAGQINAIAPPGPDSVAISVVAGCGTASERASDPVAVTMRGSAPEFLYLTRNPDGRNPVAAILPTTGEIVTDAKGGDVITIFGVGFGPTAAPGVPGAIASAAAPTLGPASVTIGGQAAKVLYSGVSPGFAGLYQVNLIVPESLPPGVQPIRIEVNGGTSPAGAYLRIAQ